MFRRGKQKIAKEGVKIWLKGEYLTKGENNSGSHALKY